MPHTQRKKKPVRTKRREELGEDGWTRITSSMPSSRGNAQEAAVSNTVPVSQEPYANMIRISGPTLTQAPDDLTLEKLRAKYDSMEKRWLSSESWKQLREVLMSQAIDKDSKITQCFLFGTGTLSGYVNGWIARHDTALVQTAVFTSVVDALEKAQGSRPVCYAQEPLYTDLDTELLSSLQITKVDHPAAFELMTETSFAYTPCAELVVSMRTLFHSPSIYLSGKLDFYWRNEKGVAYSDSHACAKSMLTLEEVERADDEYAQDYAKWIRPEVERNCTIMENYLKAHQGVAIPDLDMKDYPFRCEYLYWKKPVAPT